MADKSETTKFTSADTRDYNKPIVFMTMEEAFKRHNLMQTLKDANTILWITRERKKW